MREPCGLVWWGLNTDSSWKGANKQENVREFNLFSIEEFVRWFCFLDTEASGVVKKGGSLISLVYESHVDLFGRT